MTQRKNTNYDNPYEKKCSIVYAMELIGAKWKIPIIWHLAHYQIMHYNELRRHLSGITNTVLARNLKELEADGLVIRKSAGSVPPSVTYELTEEGKKLTVPLEGLYQWGEQHRRRHQENLKK
ncbi:helix-turn-helix domain-containing protein [uncultured Megasphaera sp.]|jgi:DNA-binding HxlR family transcriptional regulator|uniref:winged helix-turn-helix transcriptional regulator n=1 Tax=uncultured Megasphaera sp. TaxID=165188 RepID=UPI00261557CB|nr:helix-turn-helix domain-containing protein [uncultured Megasphaera sp.]